MTYVQKAMLTFLGIDDELKDDATSVYSTILNSSFYPVPVNAAFKVNAAGAVIAAPNLEFTQRNNTKRLRFSLNGVFNDSKLMNKSKLVIESVTLPNIINDF